MENTRTARELNASKDVHGALPATVATLALASCLAIAARYQLGSSATFVVASFAVAIVASVWVSAAGAAKVAKNYPQLAGLFASSGVRMIAPMVVAIVVVLAKGKFGPIESVYYVVPLYMCMLAVDVATWLKETKRVVANKCEPSVRGEAV